MAEPPTTPNLERHKSVVMLENDDALQIVRTDLANLVATAAKTNSCDIEELRKHLVDFEKLFTQFLAHRKIGNNIIWSRIQPLQTENVHTYQSVVEAPLATTKGDLLDKLVVLKLNGGLGTSMGCVGPKSLISVRNDSTFLDLTVQLIECLNKKHNSDVPLVLMNSFNTHEETQRVRFKYDKRVDLHMFQQSYHPRVLRETLRPFPVNVDLKDGVSWYPPGHGDIYNSLKRSGLLERFLEEGKEFIFISNIDNLGATVDLGILNFLLHPPKDSVPAEFVMEVTNKTRSDVKGGTLINYEGNLHLLEFAQVPKDNVDEFKSIKKFKVFNTNNLWVSLRAIKRLLDEETMRVEVIVNRKSLDGGVNVIQLETAAGAAIKNFNGAVGINVPRSRFLPVKKTSDLLVVMSNLFQLRDGTLVQNPARLYPELPLVKLGEHFFMKVGHILHLTM
ncbi:UTP--glucose-1-phosphate uridylyltransferase [Geodia barretti]|uniref:UTP--glucose-1-phosphate uridylyltransferase n=1 Tax=Geodia barretti TaxID=519541 RepID=A0AA35THQ4_GEOBA|nr:UTP--glucose-1-phosphate uridylyltransferase [Geodia barretti]